jgi:hypothetical protein
MPAAIGRVLSVVRKLIDYGKQLASTVQQRATAPGFARFAARFGTADVAAILACITNGLLRAAALEARLRQCAERGQDLAPTAFRLPATSGQRPARQVAPSSAPPEPEPADHTQDPRLARLPTADEIAAEVRCRPVGAVIADICREFGIMPDHPLWRELSLAIVMNGGDLNALLTDIFKRVYTATAERTAAKRTESPAPCPESAKPPATGPP